MSQAATEAKNMGKTGFLPRTSTTTRKLKHPSDLSQYSCPRFINALFVQTKQPSSNIAITQTSFTRNSKEIELPPLNPPKYMSNRTYLAVPGNDGGTALPPSWLI